MDRQTLFGMSVPQTPVFGRFFVPDLVFFLCGALGSAAGAWLYGHYGWWGASLLGFALPAAALLYSLTERR